jgi:hypothetical protein
MGLQQFLGRLFHGDEQVTPDTVVRRAGRDLYEIQIGPRRFSIQADMLTGPVQRAVYPSTIRELTTGEHAQADGYLPANVTSLVLERFRTYLTNKKVTFEER